jgi:hypothetical protein
MREDCAQSAHPMQESIATPDPAEICDLFVAELRGRRERLRKLLRILKAEANRRVSKEDTFPARVRCRQSAARPAGAVQAPR